MPRPTTPRPPRSTASPDTPENYQRVGWDLTEQGGGTGLTITERNLPSDEASKTSQGAWKAALGSLKEMLER